MWLNGALRTAGVSQAVRTLQYEARSWFAFFVRTGFGAALQSQMSKSPGRVNQHHRDNDVEMDGCGTSGNASLVSGSTMVSRSTGSHNLSAFSVSPVKGYFLTPDLSKKFSHSSHTVYPAVSDFFAHLLSGRLGPLFSSLV
ncbi:hypothetical protein GN956_G17759 [Arapaima gigas]